MFLKIPLLIDIKYLIITIFKKTVILQTVLLYNVFIRLKCCLHFKNKIIKEII